MAEANSETFHEAKISVSDLMGKFSEGRGEVLWLDPFYGILIQYYYYYCCPNKEFRLEKKTK